MSSRRIILNTSATYIRSVIGLAFALFSIRWVLGALGPSDFGLYMVVGTLILLVTFVVTKQSCGQVRYFTGSFSSDYVVSRAHHAVPRDAGPVVAVFTPFTTGVKVVS